MTSCNRADSCFNAAQQKPAPNLHLIGASFKHSSEAHYEQQILTTDRENPLTLSGVLIRTWLSSCTPQDVSEHELSIAACLPRTAQTLQWYQIAVSVHRVHRCGRDPWGIIPPPPHSRSLLTSHSEDSHCLLDMRCPERD